MDASQHTLNKNEKLSSTFVQLINERCNNISERIRLLSFSILDIVFHLFQINSFDSILHIDLSINIERQQYG
ncbi:unnamed protein product [Rotaria socialis]|uniref:Uncharacterized protein n=1 Tax=Rotaria socialis TaxID=392032 RepID=A0A821XSN7_9BILA|nr:unnamed protein product [Rotaria socialis]